jgi:hypothetical protein
MTTARGDVGAPYVHPGFGSADYIAMPFTRSTQATMVASAQFVAYPFYLPHDLSISALSIYLATIGAGSKLMLGIYSNVSRKPGALLTQITAEFDLSATTGIRDGALSANYALFEGVVYWLCAQTNGSSSTVSCNNNASGLHNPLLPMTAGLQASSNAGAGALAVANTYVTNTMPSTAPGSLIPSGGTNLPLPLLKVA